MTESVASAAGSFEVRVELEDLLERDLLGPWDGAAEELAPSTSPAERYLLGRLVPRLPAPELAGDQTAETAPGEAVDAEEADPSLVDLEVLAGDARDAGEDRPESETTVRSGSMAASAIGLAFSVPSDVHAVSVAAAWGRYQRAPSEIHETEQGRPRTTWHRVQAGGEVEVPPDTEDSGDLVPDPEQEGVTVHYTVRHRGVRRVVELALVNGQHAAAKTPDVARLYQVGLIVTALDGSAAIFLAHNDPDLSGPPPGRDDERLHLELLNRERREYAHGRQCAVDACVRGGERRAWQLSTTCFPAAEVPLVVPGTVPRLVLDMARLGSHELGGDELVRALRPLVAGYRQWLGVQDGRLSGDAEVARYAPAGEHALERARDVAGRLERAIEMLRENGIAREAFRFANQAMALQRVRSEVVRARLASPDADVSALLREHDVPGKRSWRPFQLAFVLLCLPGLTDPGHPDAHRGAVDPDDAEVQLLFFPTGGGKTEAYLGLAAYTFAIRRLQGVIGSGEDARDGTRGVAVLMRYTLRLLTAQQFQRAAALICACEWLRRERLAAGDSRWGTTPFRVGLWVGASVTPNSWEDADRQITESKGYEREIGGPLQLAVCPWCGSRLSGSRDLTSIRLRRRILLHCSDPEGDCPFTPRHSPHEGLPVLTVDEEIYRLTPALVIATVDKLAQLPWRAATAPLFGMVATECTIQASSRIGRDPRRPGLVVTIYQWSRPRDLAHYESFGYDHATFGLRVEGLTTTPFSDRALDRGLTGVLITAMRHAGIAALPNVAAHSVPLSGPAVSALIGDIAARAARVTHEQGRAEQVSRELQHRLDSWHGHRRAVATGRLGYQVGTDVTGLLRGPDEGGWDLWSAPLSLREVEAEIVLQLDRDDRSLREEPAWTYNRTPSASQGAGS